MPLAGFPWRNNFSSSMVCIYQINYHFFLNFQLLRPVGKTIIMSSLGSGQLDFFDLDFFSFHQSPILFLLYFGCVGLWRVFQTALNVMLWWTWEWGCWCKRTESSYEISHALIHLYSFWYNLFKTEHNHITPLPNPIVCVCTCMLGRSY